MTEQKNSQTQEATAGGSTIAADIAVQLQRLWRSQDLDGPTSDQVYKVLHEAIVVSVLPPNQWLHEVHLAKLFNVSRTPVREAILRLESDGLATRVPRRGLVVSRITPKEIVDVYVVRSAIDGLASALAAEMATPGELANLEVIHKQFVQAAAAGDYDALAEINLRFHEAIAHASGNALLISFVAHIHRLVRRFGTTTFAYPGRAQVACEVHAHLLQALANHDAPLAQQIASDDMTAARQIRISMLTEEMDSVDRTE